MQDDIELGVPIDSHTLGKPTGYGQWASWIASDPDSETFVLRKFDELAALNLLYLQSEMVEIESQLQDLHRDVPRDQYMELLDITRHWERLASLDQNEHPEAQKRMKLILRLRSKIEEYRKAVRL